MTKNGYPDQRIYLNVTGKQQINKIKLNSIYILTWKYITIAKTKTVASKFIKLGRFCL